MVTQPSMPAGLADLCARHLSTASGASQPHHIMVTDPHWVQQRWRLAPNRDMAIPNSSRRATESIAGSAPTMP